MTAYFEDVQDKAECFTDEVLSIFREKGLDFVRTLPAYDLQEIESKIAALYISKNVEMTTSVCSGCGYETKCTSCEEEDEKNEKTSE